MIEDAAESLVLNIAECTQVPSEISVHLVSHATKNIVTGEGGMVVTNNKNFADKINLYRSHGVMKEDIYIMFRHNFRLTNIQAAIGYAQFKNFDKISKKESIIKMVFR